MSPGRDTQAEGWGGNHWVITGFSITILVHTEWGEMILKALETPRMGQVFGPQQTWLLMLGELMPFFCQSCTKPPLL